MADALHQATIAHKGVGVVVHHVVVHIAVFAVELGGQ